MPNDRYRSRRAPWTCSSCSRDLRIPHWYLQFASWSTLGIVFAFCFLLGFRGVQLIVAVLLSSVPTYFIWRLLLNMIVPVALERFPSRDLETRDSLPPAQPFAPLFRCPFCRSAFKASYKRGTPVTCPTCSRQLM